MKPTVSKSQTVKPPLSPYFILAVAIVLPGVGQVLNNSALRGLLMLSFMFILGFLTHRVASPDVSVIGQYAGGIFIYAIMVMDAYYWAKYRATIFNQSV